MFQVQRFKVKGVHFGNCNGVFSAEAERASSVSPGVLFHSGYCRGLLARVGFGVHYIVRVSVMI